MVNKYNLVKLTKRHNGHRDFTHCLDFRVSHIAHPADSYQLNIVNFNNARLWLVEQYGPGVELCYLGIIGARCYTPLWAWDSENFRLRLYLSEKELMMFQIGWT